MSGATSIVNIKNRKMYHERHLCRYFKLGLKGFWCRISDLFQSRFSCKIWVRDVNRDLKEVKVFQQNWREKHHAGIYCLDEEHIKAPASGFYQNLFWGYVDELLFLLHQLLTFSSVPQSSITIRLCICGPTVLNNRDVLLYYTKGL